MINLATDADSEDTTKPDASTTGVAGDGRQLQAPKHARVGGPLDEGNVWTERELGRDSPPPDSTFSAVLAADRYHIATDLHDEIAQILFQMSVIARQLGEDGPTCPEFTRLEMVLRQQTEEATQCVRRVMGDLSPTHHTLAVALVREMEEFERHSGIRTQCRVDAHAASRLLSSAALRVTRRVLVAIRENAGVAVVSVSAMSECSGVALTFEVDSSTAVTWPGSLALDLAIGADIALRWYSADCAVLHLVLSLSDVDRPGLCQ